MNAIVVSAISGVGMMFAGLVFKKSKQIQIAASILVLLILSATSYDIYLQKGAITLSYFNMIYIDSFTAYFNMFIAACSAIYILLFKREIALVGKNDAEYFALIFFMLTGIFLLSSYNNLLILFMGIEILTIPQYILAGSNKENIKSNEASLKYFLMGAFSTGILLMGITLLYGATGTFDTHSEHFISKLNDISNISSLAFTGILLLIAALGFKVSAAPLHFWTPDVYDGTPTPLTPIMATVAKVGVFVAFIKLFHLSFGNLGALWQMTIAVMIILTLLIGNITAIYQQSVKRVMAYSSIAQAGFMLFAIYAFNEVSWKGIMLYSVVYTLATLGVFAAILKMQDQTYDGFNGLFKKNPFLAITTTICLLSLTGIPLTGGFFAKYYLLTAAIKQNQMIGLVIFAVIMAAVSSYYYFKVIISMFFKSGDTTISNPLHTMEKLMLTLIALILLMVGIYPDIVSF